MAAILAGGKAPGTDHAYQTAQKSRLKPGCEASFLSGRLADSGLRPVILLTGYMAGRGSALIHIEVYELLFRMTGSLASI